jgi:hypothetical protein
LYKTPTRGMFQWLHRYERLTVSKSQAERD